MEDPSVIVEAIKVGGLPGGLVVVLWIFMQRWFSSLDKELKELKASFGAYRVRIEGRMTRVETKLNLSVPAEDAQGGNSR